MLLQLPLMLTGKISQTKVMQNIVFIGMELKETNLNLQDYLSPGIYKLALIFHYLSEKIQLLAAGHGLIGIKLDGLQIAKRILI